MTGNRTGVQPMRVELGFLLPRLKRLALQGDEEVLDQVVGMVAHVAAWHGAQRHEEGFDAVEAAKAVRREIEQAMKGEGPLADLDVS